MQDPISRRDIIAMGGNFTVEKFDASNLPRWVTREARSAGQLQAFDGQPVTVTFEESYYAKVDIRLAEGDGHAIRLDTLVSDKQGARKLCADLVESADPEAATALRLDFRTRQGGYASAYDQQTPTWSQDDLEELGIDKDAGLYMATMKGDLTAVEHYKEMGADVMRPTFDGDRVANHDLMDAVYRSDIEECRQLLSLGADPNFPHENGRTALHEAAYRGNYRVESVEIVDALIAHGADVDARNWDQETPLHMAARRDDVKIVDTLINAGADQSARNYDSRIPLDYLHDKAGLAELQTRELDANTASAPASYATDEWSPGADPVRESPINTAETEQAQAEVLLRGRGMRL